MGRVKCREDVGEGNEPCEGGWDGVELENTNVNMFDPPRSVQSVQGTKGKNTLPLSLLGEYRDGTRDPVGLRIE